MALNELRKALAVHHTDTSEGTWDGPAAKANLKNDAGEAYYRKAFAWQDMEADPETKEAYKFIHHEVNSSGDIGPANLAGCSAGIAVLNGGRGGADIPDSDRQGVWNHLAAHLKDADREPPPLRSASEEMEFRSFQSAELRIDQAGKNITGYAAVFDEESLPIMGLFREVIRKGAFKKTIQEADIRALKNHNADYVLGRNKAGTLELCEDNKGLIVNITPPETQWANDLRESIRRGDVSQMSFAFRTINDNWFEKEDEMRRELLEVHLYEVSPVTFPAYPQTSVGLRDVFNRSIAQAINSCSGAQNTKLFKAFMRLQNKEALRNDDLSLLNDFAVKLQKQLPQSEPVQRHSEANVPTVEGHTVEFLRAQLELIEIQEGLK